MKEKIVVGVVSDTHGEVSPKAQKAIEGVDQIIHAGDFDSPEVYQFLKTLAPMQAVRGNMDRGPWANILPHSEIVTVGEVSFFVVHDQLDMDINPKAAGINIVVYGHTHIAEKIDRNGVLFLNPGSASYPRGGGKKASVAIVTIHRDSYTVEHVYWRI